MRQEKLVQFPALFLKETGSLHFLSLLAPATQPPCHKKTHNLMRWCPGWAPAKNKHRVPNHIQGPLESQPSSPNRPPSNPAQSRDELSLWSNGQFRFMRNISKSYCFKALSLGWFVCSHRSLEYGEFMIRLMERSGWVGDGLATPFDRWRDDRADGNN